MKRLVLLGEGHGEVAALPILIRKLLKERNAADLVFVDDNLIRSKPAELVKWDKDKKQSDYTNWVRRIELALKTRRDVGGVLAVFDGDFKHFPPGSGTPFCASIAAKEMAKVVSSLAKGKAVSVAVVFACCEYETWLVGGIESFQGRSFDDGRPSLKSNVSFPCGDPESHGKGWLKENCPNYRETRDQAALTKLLDVDYVREKNIRSFRRLEHAVEQLLEAVASGNHLATPF